MILAARWTHVAVPPRTERHPKGMSPTSGGATMHQGERSHGHLGNEAWRSGEHALSAGFARRPRPVRHISRSKRQGSIFYGRMRPHIAEPVGEDFRRHQLLPMQSRGRPSRRRRSPQESHARLRSKILVLILIASPRKVLHAQSLPSQGVQGPTFGRTCVFAEGEGG